MQVRSVVSLYAIDGGRLRRVRDRAAARVRDLTGKERKRGALKQWREILDRTDAALGNVPECKVGAHIAPVRYREDLTDWLGGEAQWDCACGSSVGSSQFIETPLKDAA